MAKKGHRAWNKGLTKETDERVAQYGKSVSESWTREKRQQHKIDAGKRFGDAGRKYIQEHPEHQKIASNSRTKENMKNSIKTAQEASRNPRVRKRASETFSRRYKNGEFKIGNEGIPRSEETKIKIREKLLQREPIYQDTFIELRTQEFLTSKGITFKKQYPFSITFIDIAIPDKKIAIYIDGCYWHDCPIHGKGTSLSPYDNGQNKLLKLRDYIVMRFWEHEIMESPKECIDRTLRYAAKARKEVHLVQIE